MADDAAPTRQGMAATPAPAGTPLLGRHALVTGGGRGIGAAIAERLAILGADLTLLGRSEAPLAEHARKLIASYGRKAAVVIADVTDSRVVTAAVANARTAHGAPLILINNAGGAESAPFLKTTRTLWDEMIAVNLTSAYLCIQAVLPGMLEAGWGRIVNIASTAALKGYGYVSAYCAAKHGLLGLTRSLALELARKDITVNAVCPGYTDTELVSRSIDNIVAKTGMSAEDARNEITRTNPQGRLVTPAEVASAVAWLCLPESASVTGQSIVIAGGEVM